MIDIWEDGIISMTVENAGVNLKKKSIEIYSDTQLYVIHAISLFLFSLTFDLSPLNILFFPFESLPHSSLRFFCFRLRETSFTIWARSYLSDYIPVSKPRSVPFKPQPHESIVVFSPGILCSWMSTHNILLASRMAGVASVSLILIKTLVHSSRS